MAGPWVRLEQLSKTYHPDGRGPLVLENVEATVERGEFVVLVGRSGSGKSTLLNLIGAIDVPTAGEIYIDGLALSTLDETGRALLRRRRIGFVFQFFNLIPTLTVAENLLLPLELNGRTGVAASARVSDMLAEVGLVDRADRFPDELSGGEQQRVAIARAIVHEPRIVLADEPTGNLDPDLSLEVMRIFRRFNEVGVTLLIASHDIALIDQLGCRRIPLENGAVQVDDEDAFVDEYADEAAIGLEPQPWR
jgi:putative ABC transport system ATP-binding protein